MIQIQDPLVLSSTIQEFSTQRYYLCGQYFQHKGKRLHRIVWEFHHGPIPIGHHIHHRNHDRADNVIENLACLTAAGHIAEHMTEERVEILRANFGHAQQAAREWHGSEAGHEWHKQQYEKIKDKLHAKVDHVCQVCGVGFHAHKKAKFCSNRCTATDRRASGIDDEVRVCPQCNTKFTINKYRRARCCSRSCGQLYRLNN